MENIIDLFKTYTAALPTSVVAVILILVGWKIQKAIFKILGLALIAAAVLFFILRV